MFAKYEISWGGFPAGGNLKYALITMTIMGAFAPAFAIDGNIDKGREKATTCFACHGTNGNSTNPMYPTIAGKDSDFIYARLNAYKKGEVKTPNAVMMNPLAASLSDEDMKNLAAFFSTQKAVERETGKRKRKD